jgi:hypothetical protein
MSAESINAMQVMADAMAVAGATPQQWASLEWRLDNLYWIVDKEAETVRFRMNNQQRRFVQRLWYRNLILKARQLGFSTLIAVLQLDQALFVPNHNGVIIADTLPNSGKLFDKADFAYQHLPDLLREALPVIEHNKGAKLTIEHVDGDGRPAHSTLAVGVSSRGGTVHLLHVSELGKIALKFPERANEIKTGALPSVPPDGIAIIESTAEGAFGLFWELCEPAIKRWHDKTPETRLDWRLHFFPWFEAPEYRLPDEDIPLVEIPPKLNTYFAKLEAELGVKFDAGQRAWYAKTAETLGGKMKQEYPATPEEAFEQAVEGAVLGEQMTWLRENGRLGVVPLDPSYPVNTFWDFGVADATAIWFHQCVGLQHRWFYYHEGTGRGLAHYWINVLEAHRQRHRYQWGQHFLPHDAEAEILGEVVTTKRRILEGLGMRNIVVVPRVATISQGIELMRLALKGNHWFDKHTADEGKGEDMGAGAGVKCLDGYQFQWNDKAGVWSNEPLHNWASHGADAWRQFAQGWTGHSLSNSDAFAKFKRRERRGL